MHCTPVRCVCPSAIDPYIEGSKLVEKNTLSTLHSRRLMRYFEVKSSKVKGTKH